MPRCGARRLLEDYPVKRRGDGADRRSLVTILVEDGDRAWSLQDTVCWVRHRLRPHFPPQPLDAKRIRYSDTNHQLLVGIIEPRRSAPFLAAPGGSDSGPPGNRGHSETTNSHMGPPMYHATIEIPRTIPTMLPKSSATLSRSRSWTATRLQDERVGQGIHHPGIADQAYMGACTDGVTAA